MSSKSKSIIMFVFVFLFGITTLAYPEVIKAGNVEAIVLDETVRFGVEGVDEGTIRYQSQFPKYPQLYVPMPLPERADHRASDSWQTALR